MTSLRKLCIALALATTIGGGASGVLAQARDTVSASTAAMEAVDDLLAQGQELFAQGRYEEALGPFTAALTLSEETLGAGPYTALVLTNLGLSQASAGRLSEADQTYSRAAAIEDAVYVRGGLSRLPLLINRGQLYSNTARPSEALPLLEEALLICSQKCPPEDGRVAYIRSSLAKVYRDLGRSPEAEALDLASSKPGR